MVIEHPSTQLSASAILESILGNQADWEGLDEALKASLQNVRELLGVEVAATYLVASGETSFAGACLTAIAGAGFRKRERLVLPPALVEQLSRAPHQPHRLGAEEGDGTSVADVLPALAGRVRAGVVIGLSVGERVLGALLLGAGEQVCLDLLDPSVLEKLAEELALMVNRKNAQELLAHTRLITAVEYAGEAIEVRDVRGQIEYINPAYESLTGYGSSDLLGQDYRQFLRSEPHDVATDEERLRAVSQGEVWRGKLVGIRHDGSHCHFGVTESPVIGQDGSISHFVSVRRDITERVHAEQALRRSEEKLSMTLDSMGDGLIVTGFADEVVRMNPAAERFTGVMSGEAVGRPITEVLQLVDATTGESIGHGALKEVLSFCSTLQGSELAVRSSEGAERPVSLSATPLVGQYEEGGAIIMLRDMSEQHAAMAALIESQRDFRELIARSPDGIAISADNRWVFVNPAFASALGYDTAAQLIGHPVEEVVLPEDRVRLEAVGQEHGDGQVEVRLRRSDGAAAPFEISAPREVSFEGADGLLYFARDVTARKEMESQLLLADRMVSVGTLAAGVAHEVNNPLAYVIANLDFLKERLSLMAASFSDIGARELLEALEESREGAERVRCIVRDLKHFTRGDEESLELIDVRVVLESSISVAFNEIRHRAELVRELGDVPPVYANKARLGQLFLNLLINAAQALEEGRASRNQITVRTGQTEDGSAVVEVFDTGPGIAEELQDRVFDPFFTTKPVGEGTGLGLSICHNIVTSAGGTIGFAPSDTGTCVVVTLPQARDEQLPAQPVELAPLVESPAEEEAGSARILVADDEPAVARALKRALSRYEVEVVADGAAALEKWRENPFDLMFCDLMMPGLMGSDVYVALEQDGQGFHERLVFMTGGAFTAEARQFLEDVPNETIEKPFDVPAIQALARRMVCDLRAAREASIQRGA